MNGSDDDIRWLNSQQPQIDPPDADTTGSAREALMTHARPTTRLVVAATPIRSRRRRTAVFARSRRAITMAAAVAVVAVAGVTAMLAAGPSHHGMAPGVANAQTLVNLANQVAGVTPTGNATLVVHHNTIKGRGSFTGADLYLDSGSYYYAETPAGLPAALKASPQDYTLKPVIDAMARESSGDPQAARAAFLKAADPNFGGDVQHASTAHQDNVIWVEATDVVGAAYGHPAVLAGTLRALATVHGVSVTRGHLNGVPTLEISMFVPKDVATVARQKAAFESKIKASGLTDAQRRALRAQQSNVHTVTTPAHYMRMTVNGRTGAVIRYTDIGLVVTYHVSRVDTAQYGGR